MTAFKLQKEPPKFDIETDRDYYDDWKDKWHAFERLSNISSITDKTEKGQVRLDALREACSYSTLRVIRNLALEPPENEDVDKILAALTTHIQGSTNNIVWIRKFFQRHQRVNESTGEWLIDLQDIAKRCKFSSCCCDCENLRLRDQIVLGVRDEGTLKKLLQTGSSLTYKKAKEICEADEAAQRDRCSLAKEAEVCSTTHKGSTYKAHKRAPAKPQAHSRNSERNTPHTGSGCSWCGGPSWHSQNRAKCPAKNSTCNKCKKKGHWAKMCRFKGESEKDTHQPRLSGIIASLKLPAIADPTPKIVVNVNGEKILAMPDSGANVDAAGPDFLLKARINQDITCTENPLILAANGSKFSHIGSAEAEIELDGSTASTTIHIMRELGATLILKWTTCQALGILPQEFPAPHKCDSADHEASRISSVRQEKAHTGPTTGDDVSCHKVQARAQTTSGHNGENVRSQTISPTPRGDVNTQARLPQDAQLEGARIHATSPWRHDEITTQTKLRDLKSTLLTDFADVFSSTVKSMEGGNFKIRLKASATPHSITVCRRTPVPLLDKLKRELDLLEDQKIIKKVYEPTEWVSPIVIVPKKDSDQIRLCTDFSRLNEHILRERYFSPTPTDLISQTDLSQCRFFTVVDALKGYFQVPLDEESQPLTTFLTPYGRYCYLVAPMGLCSISEHYNRRMDQALEGLQRVYHIVDDCLIASPTWEEHVKDVQAFLQRCRDRAITLNRQKFTFAQSTITFAGLQISSHGYSIDPKLIEALQKFPTPVSKTDVRAFFGLVNQLSNLSNQISRLMAPLQPLLRKDTHFSWDENHQRAFEEVRRELSQAPLCVSYFDPAKPTRICTDASRLNGLGFVIKQEQGDGTWTTVQAGSRFLSDAEKRYAMVELELLGVAWGITKGRMFLEGLPYFEVWTDHKPLIPLLNDYAIDRIENPRLQRLRLKLMRFSFKAFWLKSKDNAAADALSRAPLDKPAEEDIFLEGDEHRTALLFAMNVSQLDPRLEEVAEAAKQDEEYCELRETILSGFPNEKAGLSLRLRPYWKVRHDLSVDNDLIVYGRRLLIPQALRADVLERLKHGHMGVVKTKARARNIVWWPNIDQHIETATSSCVQCQKNLPSHPKEPMSPRPMPTRAFQEIHVDLCDFRGSQFLVIVDGYSGWPALYHLGVTATSNKVTNYIRQFFCQTAVPETLWSDGGPQFTASTFQSFLRRWGVRHRISSPHYPASNGRAEAAVKQMKKILRGSVRSDGSVDRDEVVEAVLLYKNTPLYDGRIPSLLVYGRPVRDTLPAHRRNFDSSWQKEADEMEDKAAEVRDRVEEKFNESAKPLRELYPGARVAVQHPNTRQWNKYGIIVEKLKHKDYLIKLGSGRIIRRNRRFIRRRFLVPSCDSRDTSEHGDTASLGAPETPSPAQAIPIHNLRPRHLVAPPRRFIEEFSNV